MDEYARLVCICRLKINEILVFFSIIVDCTVGLPIENVTYFGAKFYNFDKNETMSINLPAWIGVCQTSFMVVS